MILSTNAFNWAALRSGLSMGDFCATLTPEREMELFKQYNEWRRSKGLAEEAMPTQSPAPVASSPAPKKPEEDALSALITEVAAEVEEEEAEDAALIQDALDGADEIVEEAREPVPAEVEEEIEADEAEPIPEEEIETEEPLPEAEEAEEPMSDAPEAASTQAVVVEAAPQSVDFTTVIRSLPKTSDPALYRQIVSEYGEETLPMAQAALKEATKKHRGTAAIRAFIAYIKENEGASK